MYGYLRLETMRMLRDVKFAVISLVSPLLMYLVISNGATGPSRQATIVFLTVTMAAFGAMGAVLNGGSSGLAEDKGLGWLRQLRLTPLRPRDVVLARGMVILLGALPPDRPAARRVLPRRPAHPGAVGRGHRRAVARRPGLPQGRAVPMIVYHLSSGGQANTVTGDGLLAAASGGPQPPDACYHDPFSPVPAGDQAILDVREDVLCYTGPARPWPGR